MTTYLVALMLVVASIQIYLLWRLLSAFDVLRRFDDRLSRYGDALSLLTETTETGFDSVGRELERLRTLGDIRAEMRAGRSPAAAPSAPAAAAAPRHAAAEAVAEALIARVDATPAHTLVARDLAGPASNTGGLIAGVSNAAGPTVAFVPVAGEVAPRVRHETPRAAAPTPSVTFIDTMARSRPATDGDLQSASVPATTSAPAVHSSPTLERRRALGFDSLDEAAAPERTMPDPVGDVVRLIESAQGRPSPAQLNEAAVRLRMHLADGTARARGTARGAATVTRGRQESPNGALRS